MSNTIVSGGGKPNPADVADFWRSASGVDRPDDVTDQTDAIHRSGLVGLGAGVPGSTPAASLDVGRYARSGTDRRGLNAVLYVTGTMPALSTGPTFPTPAAGSQTHEFLHNNQSAGIGFAWNGLYATGSPGNNNDLILQTLGSGTHRNHWQALLGAYAYHDRRVNAALTNGQGFLTRWIDDSRILASDYLIVDGTKNAMRRQATIWAHGAERNAYRVQGTTAVSGNTEFWIGENQLHKRKVLLYDGGVTAFVGLGATPSAQFLSSVVNGWQWTWENSSNAAEVMNLHTNGQMRLPLTPTAPGGLPSGTLWRDPADGNRLKMVP